MLVDKESPELDTAVLDTGCDGTDTTDMVSRHQSVVCCCYCCCGQTCGLIRDAAGLRDNDNG